MEIVYIETTIVSLLTSTRSGEISIAVQQQATHDWWEHRRMIFECITSDETRVECARGDAQQARLRLAILAQLPSITITQNVERLAAEFLNTKALPEHARADAIHLAAATSVRADYLLTWNCRHLANAQILRRLEREATRYGWALPTVCTPFELMGEFPYGNQSNS